MHEPASPDRGPETDPWWSCLDPRRSLRARATLGVGGAILVFTLLISWITGTFFHRQLAQQIGGSLETLADQTGDKLDRGLAERYREIQFAASLAPLRIPDNPVDVRRHLLDSLLNDSPEYAWLGFANPAGTIIFATQHQLEGTQVETRPWFRNARNKPYADDVHEVPELAGETAASGGPPPRFVDLAVPVVSNIGQFLGVLGAHLSWSSARDVQLSVIPDLMAQQDHIGLTLYSATGEMLLDSGASGWTEPPAAPILPERQESSGFFWENTLDGSAYLTGYARSHGYGEFRGFGWLAVVRQPVAVAFAPVQELQRRILRTGLGFAVIAVGMSWLLAGRLARRFRAIGASARRIGTGDILAVLPQARGRGDLPNMCAELGGMVDKLRGRQEELEADNTRLAARLHAHEKAKKT
jgi:hypothetical protein